MFIYFLSYVFLLIAFVFAILAIKYFVFIFLGIILIVFFKDFYFAEVFWKDKFKKKKNLPDHEISTLVNNLSLNNQFNILVNVDLKIIHSYKELQKNANQVDCNIILNAFGYLSKDHKLFLTSKKLNNHELIFVSQTNLNDLKKISNSLITKNFGLWIKQFANEPNFNLFLNFDSLNITKHTLTFLKKIIAQHLHNLPWIQNKIAFNFDNSNLQQVFASNIKYKCNYIAPKTEALCFKLAQFLPIIKNYFFSNVFVHLIDKKKNSSLRNFNLTKRLSWMSRCFQKLNFYELNLNQDVQQSAQKVKEIIQKNGDGILVKDLNKILKIIKIILNESENSNESK